MLARKLMVGVAGGGGGGGVVVVPSGTVSSFGAGVRTATVRFANNGSVYTGDNATFSLLQAWKVTGEVAGYEIRATVVVGSVSGITATWLSLATTRDWSVTDTSDNGNGVLATITLEIRYSSTLAVLATGNWDLLAERVG